jgi:hypothetical protein
MTSDPSLQPEGCTMVERAERRGTPRRELLKGLGLGAGVAAAVAVAPAAPVLASEGEDEKRKARYQESEHVKTFYATNRY